MSKTCAFCPQEADTGEHLWSNWMGPLLKMTSFQVRDGIRKKTWTKRSIRQRVDVVCHECNNGWMSQLEEKYAKPAMAEMIHSGRDTFIVPRDICSIAIFAFKHAVVADHAGFHRTPFVPFFPQADRWSFRNSLTIPEGVQMWIGRFNAHKGFFRSVYHKVRSKHFFNGLEFYVFTYVAGFLVFQVVAQSGTDGDGKQIPLGKFLQNPIWDSFSTSLWLSDGHAIHWPPPRNLSNQIIEDFSKRFSSLDLSFG